MERCQLSGHNGAIFLHDCWYRMMISIRVLVASTAIASVALATPVSAPVAAQSGPAAIDRAATSIADSETAMRHA